MELSSDVCNRCRLVCVKFCLNRISFAVFIEKCLGGSLFWDTVYSAKFASHNATKKWCRKYAKAVTWCQTDEF